MEEIIKEMYATELQGIEIDGKLPEWKEEKSRVVSFYYDQNDKCVWDNKGRAFWLRDDKVLPLKPVAENEVVRVFLFVFNQLDDRYILILNKQDGDCFRAESTGRKPYSFKLLGKTVAIKLTDDLRVLWDFTSLNESYDDDSLYKHMEYIRDINYYNGKENFLEVKGLVPGSDKLETMYFEEQGAALRLSEKRPGIRSESELIKAEAVPSFCEVKSVISVEYWYPLDEVFYDTSVFNKGD